MNGNYKGTEHYTLTKTENGWHGDPDDCEWQWFDFPDLTFTDDGDCQFYLEAESIDMAVELDEYREFLTILSNEIEELRQQIDAARAEAERPFPQEAELRTKSARLAELDAALNMDRGSGAKQKDMSYSEKDL